MRRVGFEPTSPEGHVVLSHARQPVAPPPPGENCRRPCGRPRLPNRQRIRCAADTEASSRSLRSEVVPAAEGCSTAQPEGRARRGPARPRRARIVEPLLQVALAAEILPARRPVRPRTTSLGSHEEGSVSRRFLFFALIGAAVAVAAVSATTVSAHTSASSITALPSSSCGPVIYHGKLYLRGSDQIR